MSINEVLQALVGTFGVWLFVMGCWVSAISWAFLGVVRIVESFKKK